ncbi:phage tail tube protein [Pseudarthrobacter sp. S9]|uniref:phage tail tube protein n=1 Tax=Pseudarthrobacter sp. S9 TaxID=3418421 RepID=UPI003D057988
MPTNFPRPGSQQWFGLAKETTYGTPVATPTMWIPVDSPKWEPKVTPLVDQALRGMMGTDYGQAQGMRHDELSYKTMIYADTIFPHLMAILGGTDTMTGTTPTVTHAVSLNNTSSSTLAGQPSSYTGFLYQLDGKVVQIPGMVISDLKITFKADTLPTVDATWIGLPGAFITAPTNTPSTLPPMPPFTATITVGGVAATQYSDCSFDIKRSTAPVAVLNGTQSPLAIFAGPLSVSGSLLAIYQGTADTDLAALLSNTQPTLSVALYQQGDATHPLTLQCSKIAYDSAAPAGSNTSFATIATSFKALMNSTDALDGKLSPIQAKIINAQSTAY